MTFGRSSLADVTAGRDPHFPFSTMHDIPNPPCRYTLPMKTLATILAELLEKGGQLTIHKTPKDAEPRSQWNDHLPPLVAMVTVGAPGMPDSLSIAVRSEREESAQDEFSPYKHTGGLEQSIRDLHRKFVKG